MTVKPAIRELRIEDYDQLIKLWNEAGLPSRPFGRDTRKAIENQLRLRTAIYLIVEIEGRIVGSVLGTHDGRKGWINRLAVLPELQHRGIARQLVREVEKRLAACDIHIVACLIESWNGASLEVFKRLGYEPLEGMHYLRKRDRSDV